MVMELHSHKTANNAAGSFYPSVSCKIDFSQHCIRTSAGVDSILVGLPRLHCRQLSILINSTEVAKEVVPPCLLPYSILFLENDTFFSSVIC